MPTFNQLVRKGRQQSTYKSNSPARAAETQALDAQAKTPGDAATRGEKAASGDAALFNVFLPRDVRREVVVPAGVRVAVGADAPLRARLVDPATGKTLCVARSSEGRVVFTAPAYEGDGTRCRRLRLEAARYVEGRPAFE